MANRTATLYVHYKSTDGKWAYAKPVVKANGRIKPLHVLDVKCIEASERSEDDAAAMIPGRTWKGAR